MTNQSDQPSGPVSQTNTPSTFKMIMQPDPANDEVRKDKSKRTFEMEAMSLDYSFFGLVVWYEGWLVSLFKDAVPFRKHIFKKKKDAKKFAKMFTESTDK